MSNRETFTGNKGLVLEEALIFDIGQQDKSGVDIPSAPEKPARLGIVPIQCR